jgi:hypothetical protein
MSRSIIAAFFLSLLFGFQAEKLFNYLNCRIRNISDNTTKCDCEKQVKDQSDNAQPPSSTKSIINDKAEELFLQSAGSFPGHLQSLSLKKCRISHLNTVLHPGFYASIFRPPDLSCQETTILFS